jgi:hypothetical protein
MRVHAVIVLVVAAALTARVASAGHPVVRAAAEGVDEVSATATVTDLVAFGTRYSATAGCDGASDYLFNRLQAMGLAPRLEPFTWGAQTLYNVSARHVGVVDPDEIYLVVAHHDSTSEDPLVAAPGADDDASGVACVLEAARMLSQSRFEASIEFLLTAGEEQGLLGSQADAQEAVAAGENIAGVINHDMVAYWPTGWARDLDVDGNARSQRIVDAYARASAEYVPGMAVGASLDWGVCDDDQWSYDQAGFPAIIVMDCHEAHMGMDGETTPNYHQTTDTVATLDLPRMTQVARATTATAAMLARPLRRLLRNGELPGAVLAGTILRQAVRGDAERTAIDPAGAGTLVLEVATGPHVDTSSGEPAGPGAGSFVLYESDRDETIRLSRSDADSDGLRDIVVGFGP